MRTAIFVVAATLLTGCANETTVTQGAADGAPSVPAPAGFIDAGPVVRLAQTQQLGGGETLSPAAKTDTPSVSAAAVYAKCNPSGCGTAHAPSIELANVTFPEGFQNAGQSPVTNRLAYVFTWKHEPCASHGRVPTDGFCTVRYIVDANTGDVLDDVWVGEAASATSSAH